MAIVSSESGGAAAPVDGFAAGTSGQSFFSQSDQTSLVPAVITAVTGEVGISGAGGAVHTAQPGEPLHPHDVVATADGARLEIRLADGRILTVAGPSRCIIGAPDEADAGRTLSLHVIGGRYTITPGNAGDGAVLVVQTAAGQLTLHQVGLLLEATVPDVVRFALVTDGTEPPSGAEFVNARANAWITTTDGVVTVQGDDRLPLLADASANCGDFENRFADMGSLTDPVCASDEGVRLVETAVGSEPLDPPKGDLSGDPTEVSAGGDPAALVGDAFSVTQATTGAYDLTASAAPLADVVSQGGAPTIEAAAENRHTAEALFQNQPAPSTEVSLPEPLILRQWDPGRRWEALGQADEFAGQVPELPLESTRLISARQGEMAVLEATDVSRLQIEEFLTLGHGTLAELVPDTNPTTGAAIKALNTIGLEAGQSIRFDVFFDAAGAATLNDFAVFSVSVAGQSLALPITTTSDVGDFGASGWRTIEYTTGITGRYTFGFAVLNDGPAVALSRLYVDNVRREETSGFVFETLDSIGDNLGGAFRVLAPAPVAVDDTLRVGEDGILAAQPTTLLLANDRDPDPFDPLAIVGLDRTGTTGRISVGGGNTFTYDPAGRFEALAAGEIATDHFAYFLDGGNGLTTQGTVTVAVVGANDAPMAIADAALAEEDGPPVTIAVTANDVDVDSDDDASTLRVVGASAQSGATVRFTSIAGAPITYVPPANGDLAADTITYTIEDRHGARATGIVNVLITTRNDAPLAGDDVAAVSEDGTININVLANDRDPDGNDVLGLTALDLAGTRGAAAIDGSIVRYSAVGRFDDLAQGAVATDHFTYGVKDAAGAGGTAMVAVTVTGRNDVPVASVDRAVAVEHGDPVAIDVLANDDDVDSDDSPATLKVVAASAASGAAVTFSGAPGDGIVYHPDQTAPWPLLPAGATAEDVITYTIEDRWGARAEGSAVVTVQGVNDPVQAHPDAFIVAANAPTVLAAPGLLANDTDADSTAGLRLVGIAGVDVGNVVDITLPSGARLSAGVDGTVAYDPAGAFDTLAVGQTATDGFDYVVSDGSTTDVARVTITVKGTNDAPVANPDVAHVGEDGPDIAVNVLANDDDVDSDDTAASLKIVAASAASGATMLFSGRPGEGLRYAPAASFQSLAAGQTASDTVSYTIADSHGATASGTLTVEITGLNDRPVAVSDRYNIDASSRLEIPQALGLLANDHDADAGDQLSVVAVNGSTITPGSTIALASGALLTVATDGSFIYDPNGRFAGLDPFAAADDGFSYAVADASGAEATATVDIRIFKDNQPPVAADDQAVTNADQAIRIPVLLNDVDPERALLRVAGIDTNQTLGSVRVNDDGTVTYDPDGAFSALAPGETATDRFSYVVDDDIGGRDTALVNVTVRGVGYDAGAAAELLQSFEESYGLFVAGWGREPGEAATSNPIQLVTSYTTAGATFGPTHFEHFALIEARGSSARRPGTAQSAIEAFLGVPGGTLPDDDGRHSGETGDHSEPDTGAAVRTVLSINDSDRDAQGRVILAFDWNFISAEKVADNASGRNDYAIFTITDGTVTHVITLADSREIGLGTSGWRTTTYDLTAAFPKSSGTELTVGFAVINDESSINVSSLLLDKVRLNPSLDGAIELIGSGEGGALQTWRALPIAVDDGASLTRTMDEDHALTIAPAALLGNDSASAGATASSLAIVGVDGSATRGHVTLGASGPIYDPSGRFDALREGEQANDAFAYTIIDANGGRATAVATIIITGRNDAPLAATDEARVQDSGGSVSVDVLANDLDPDDDTRTLRVIAASAASGAEVRFTGGPGAEIVYDHGSRFRELSAGETASDTIAYKISDPHGAIASGLATITIVGTNAAPVAADDVLHIDQNTVATLALTANDVDEDRADRLAVTAIDGTSIVPGGMFTLASGAYVTLIDDGSVRYDPSQAFIALGAGEQAHDAFHYQISDGFGGTDEAEVAVTVVGLNDVPIASLDTMTTSADQSLTINPADLLANDFDPDHGDVIRFVDVNTFDARGVVSYVGGHIFYDPAGRFTSLGEGETATDSFVYQIADHDGFTAAGEVAVTVVGINDPPTAVADLVRTDEHHSVDIDVLVNDTDPDATDHLVVSSIDTKGTIGTVTLAADGSVTYDPAGHFDALTASETATDSFQYTVSDAFGRSDTTTVTVTINGRNDVERLIESFESPLTSAARSSSFAATTTVYQETDGAGGSYLPTDGAEMARLEARGSTASDLAKFLGLDGGTLPKDIDGSSPAFGSAIKVKTTVAAGDEISFDWMFDARDAVHHPADGYADNDYVVVVINDAAGTNLFKLTDVRTVGDHGASGWQTSVYTAPAAGDLVIGFGVVNDRSPEPIAENSFLLVDNLRVNRDLDEGYRSVANEHDGGLTTLVHQTS